MVCLDPATYHCPFSVAVTALELGHNHLHQAGAFRSCQNPGWKYRMRSAETLFQSPSAAPEKQNMHYQTDHRRKVDIEARGKPANRALWWFQRLKRH